MALPRPHGGKLVEQTLAEKEKERILASMKELPHIDVDAEVGVDIENIAHGVFSPLEGFMHSGDYDAVINHMRLEDDTPWSLPIVLHANFASLGIKEGDSVIITHNGTALALMEIEDIYKIDKKEYGEKVFKTTDVAHPGVAKVMSKPETVSGGRIYLINPMPNPFERYTLWPIETRILFKEKGWRTVVGFQTRNAPHLGHEYVQKTALTFVDGLFINPVIGKKKKGDFKDEVILKSYEELINHYYLKDKATMAILRTEMRYAGPREAIFHAIVRKNFGCTHFIVGRDHAGVGNYYGPYDAQEIFSDFPDLGITPVFFKRFYYCKRCSGYVNEHICPHSGNDIVPPSGTKIREILMQGKVPPNELMREEVAKIILSFDDPFV